MNNVCVQHESFIHLAKKIFEVFTEHQHEIDRLKLEAIHDKDTIKHQDAELLEYKAQLVAVGKKV